MFDSVFELANHLLRKRQLDEAVALYIELLKKEAKFRPYYENLIFALNQSGKYQDAQYYQKEMIRIFPEIAPALKLSIIIPVHNTLPYLRQCIDSVLHQRYRNFELIIVDDGSTDGSTDLLREYERQSKQIRLIVNDQASGNPGTPRNQALAQVTGQYVGFVDSDDWIDPDFFQTLMSEAALNDADIVISAGFNNHVGNDVTLRKYHSPDFKRNNVYFADYHESFMIWDKVFRADLIKKHAIQLGETKAAVDVPFIFKAYFYAKNVVQSNQTFGYHYRRETPSSVTVNYRKKSSCDFEFEAYQSIAAWAKEIGVTNAFSDIISIKKITSFVYTLKLINPDEFESFYQRVKAEFEKVDRTMVERFARELKKKWVLDAYDDVMRLDSHAYFSSKRVASLEAAPVNAKNHIKPVFNLDGDRPGILFFPAWVKSNPYQSLFYRALNRKFDCRVQGFRVDDLWSKPLLIEKRKQFDYIHLHWLHNYIDIESDNHQEIANLLSFAKEIGYQLIYTAHNIVSHESANAAKEVEIRRKLIHWFDIIIAQGEMPKQVLVEQLQADPEKIQVVYHGVYEDCYENNLSQSAARQMLGIEDDAFVFLFFGAIRGYKGVLNLIREFKQIQPLMPKAILLLAGRANTHDLINQINSEIGENDSILLHARFIEDSEVQIYFNAADAYVLPYERILSSGSFLLGMTFNKPTIAPQKGVLPELLDDDKGQLFANYNEMGQVMRDWYDAWKNKKFDQKFPKQAFSSFIRRYQWDTTLQHFNLDNKNDR